MTLVFRRLLVVLTVLLAGFVVSGCSASSQGTPGAAGTSGTTSTGPAFMDVKLTPSSIIVSNKAGQPLKDVYLKVKSNRGSSVYQTRLSKMESSERREIPLTEFKTPGGLPWRSGKPAQFLANAEDFVGAKRDMAMALN